MKITSKNWKVSEALLSWIRNETKANLEYRAYLILMNKLNNNFIQIVSTTTKQ